MAKLKTSPDERNPEVYLSAIENDSRRQDCREVAALMEEITGAAPQMWGSSIVGFGTYHYVYESGREGDWFLTGFSSRKQNLTLYIMSGFDKYEELMSRLGKYKTGKSCLYLKKLDDIDRGVLKELIQASVDHLRS